MKSNHPFLHEEEVEAEAPGYDYWSVKVDDAAAVNMTTKKLFSFLSGSGIDFSFDSETNSLTVSAPDKAPKPNKPIDAAAYTIEAADKGKWLVVNQDCVVTVPKGLTVAHIFEGEANAGATVTFQAETDAALNHVASISKTLSPYGVFGIRVKALNNYTIYGTDPINYNG